MSGEKHFTSFGSVGTEERNNDDVTGGTVVGKQPGMLRLVNQSGVGYWLWVDNVGDLRIHTALPTDPDANGTVVGTQT
ncbi:MAG: hypothetical protein ACW987_08945 [Candidatus Thorarchaeota archaeon]|jgi:hypothetical protein